MTRTISDPTVTVPRGAAGRLAQIAAAVAVAADLGLMLLIGELIAPLVTLGALTVAAIALAARSARSGLLVLVVLSVVTIAAGAPFLAADLASPADPGPFLWAVLSGGGRLLVVVVAVLALRGRHDAASTLATVAVGVAALALAGSLLARAAVGSDVARPGDVEVVLAHGGFPSRVVVEEGGTLHLDNRDRYRHTFTVGEALDVMLAAGVQRRAEVTLPAGTYEITCEIPGHTMTGILEVRP